MCNNYLFGFDESMMYSALVLDYAIVMVHRLFIDCLHDVLYHNYCKIHVTTNKF